VLVALAGVAVWLNHFESTFQDEDFYVVVKNPAIQNLANIPQFFKTPLHYADQPEHAEYRPLALVSFAIDYQLASPISPQVFDVDSFAWFLCEVLLVGGLFLVLPGSNRKLALLAVAVFAVHPVTGETLNYISRRGDILGAVGLVAGLAFWIVWPRRLPPALMHWEGVPKTDWDDFRRRWTPRVNGTYRRIVDAPVGLYMIPVVFGMLADPGVAVFPLLLLAYILLLDNGPEQKAPWRRVLPSAVICLPFWILQLVFTWKYAVGFRLSSFPYWITQPWVVLRYIASFFVPVHLTAESDLTVFSQVWSPLALVGMVGLAGVIALALFAGRHVKWRAVAFGIWWFLIALLPTLLVPQRAAESDARMYLALPGLALATVWCGWILYGRIAESSSNKLAVSIAGSSFAAALILVLCVLTFERNEMWSSQMSFWEDATEKSPRNGRSFVEYGAVLNAAGQPDRGYASLLHAASLITTDAPDQIRLALAFDQADKDKEAEEHFKRAIADDPNYSAAWSAYSQWLILRRREQEAYAAALRATQLSPWNAQGQHTLLQYYADKSDWTNLNKAAMAVLRRNPTDVDGKRSVVVAQAAFGAVKAAEEKVKNQPTVDDYLALSVQYYRNRRFQDSIKACNDALKLRPDLGEAYSNMAAAYYALGNKDEAIKALREALRIRPDIIVARRNLDFLLSLEDGAKLPPQIDP